VSEALLETAANILGPLVDEVVFVGGATIHLWLTEAAAPPVRATDDVDVICDVTSYVQYQALAERLRDRGLEEAIDEPVICRWRHRDTGLAIDVMPTSEDVLGSRIRGTSSESLPRSSFRLAREYGSAQSHRRW
jgi:hypothetical protein